MQDVRAVHRQGGSGHFLPGVDRVHEDSLVTGRPSLWCVDAAVLRAGIMGAFFSSNPYPKP